MDAPDADDALLCSLGLGGPDRDAFVAESIRVRRISERRKDAKQIIGAFGARSTLELAFRGHGLSLTDKLWYRAPGSAERWEDVNFFDNDWDGAYLLKEPLFENGHDLIGASLAAELCGLLYGQDAYQPLNVAQRFGRRFVSSPLMLGRDEELVQTRGFSSGWSRAIRNACAP